MSIWEQIRRPSFGKPDRLSESSPIFQKYFLIMLRRTILEKKFPFYESYQRHSVEQAMKADPEDDIEPLIAEVAEYEKKLKNKKSAELIKFAKEEGLELTDEEIQAAKNDAKDVLIHDPEL
ncbi:hypothetical protein A2823_02195 [Candidatus Nomurabacteria bacterium RIFCSPHIGHO2_01_FULL_41_91]|uniref:Uncharacterized protein n=1 Tax=Candidatus Nomurabacteria bacterium RIFCSPLOWO2_12_FULL_41_10 TaxID=1801795 RepID=A0A1F6YDG5_9BACT|nr:MAG: hypothetical protein A2823_02195 [Candidatus Nomurabacteria bacterium RIFCSPHIGHO2_01_FULL_41_91]OGI80568.1 MAG: hypothetical protein A3D43_01970 [Candidatus Nomurabacteria bacterium RIFCSPHIGHO2_02_FULL_41_52]OGI84459.1 MAG: hypothetical protein A3F49_03390 [Candidatus Nomurabacteria bacterium RIFCSPHIGHO2_12_FULL_42_19]OGI93696.1 MAG: hypothetical protein A3A07_02575 [Candidatus Nomurabacteria bacterium RIFCSPLOWO2_01_FULL_41_52]OGI99769.1 MAG: hypothetical protein A3H56_01230 [Candid